MSDSRLGQYLENARPIVRTCFEPLPWVAIYKEALQYAIKAILEAREFFDQVGIRHHGVDGLLNRILSGKSKGLCVDKEELSLLLVEYNLSKCRIHDGY